MCSLATEVAARSGIELTSLDDLYARSDFISVHTPLTAETRGLVGEAAFAKMKKGVRVVNCARGELVDEAALREDEGRPRDNRHTGRPA